MQVRVASERPRPKPPTTDAASGRCHTPVRRGGPGHRLRLSRAPDGFLAAHRRGAGAGGQWLIGRAGGPTAGPRGQRQQPHRRAGVAPAPIGTARGFRAGARRSSAHRAPSRDPASGRQRRCIRLPPMSHPPRATRPVRACRTSLGMFASAALTALLRAKRATRPVGCHASLGDVCLLGADCAARKRATPRIRACHVAW